VGGELIHEIAAAMAKRMTVHELAAMPHYHPTLAEIWTYPAEELAAKGDRKSLSEGRVIRAPISLRLPTIRDSQSSPLRKFSQALPPA
jgi:hypothetical protein